MNTFFLSAAMIVLLMVALGLLRVIRGPAAADRMMGAQLLGSGGIAVLLLAGIASDTPASIDAALVLALLAPFATVGFVRNAESAPTSAPAENPPS